MAVVDERERALLGRGDRVEISNRDDFLEALHRLHAVPARKGRNQAHRERGALIRYLAFLAATDSHRFPRVIEKVAQDPPDFQVEWRDGSRESIEITEASTREYQARLTRATANGSNDLELPVEIDTKREKATEMWADIVFSAFELKSKALVAGRFEVDHLLIYDLTGLNLFVPLAWGGRHLRDRIRSWLERVRPKHRFRSVSVLRDTALLLDILGAAEVLRGESPYFQLPAIRARDEEDLKQRLRAIDKLCRDSGIRHLKMFGSALGDMEEDFDERSDLDLLVQFEPGRRVTLLDMARLERRLSDLIGLRVDLKTAEDLSRHFRADVLEEAREFPRA